MPPLTSSKLRGADALYSNTRAETKLFDETSTASELRFFF